MARAKVEQHPATGTTMVVMVGLGIAFLLFMAFLNVVKSGNILSEAVVKEHGVDGLMVREF